MSNNINTLHAQLVKAHDANLKAHAAYMEAHAAYLQALEAFHAALHPMTKALCNFAQGGSFDLTEDIYWDSISDRDIERLGIRGIKVLTRDGGLRIKYVAFDDTLGYEIERLHIVHDEVLSPSALIALRVIAGRMA